VEKVDYLIIGGGIAGTTAAETIRSKDPQTSITILTEESTRLYSRVLLPHYLRNENTLESVFLRKDEDYSEKNINLITKIKVENIDTSAKTVKAGEQEFTYSKLLIASGGKVNRLKTKGADLPEVLYLRTLEDAQRIKEFINKSREAVVLGGGFIAIELAQSLTANKVKATVVMREKYFWENVVGENSGKLLSNILEKNGVNILPGEEVTEFKGAKTLEGVLLTNGKFLPASIAGVGIGIYLDLNYLEGSNLVIKKGIVTNEFLETSVPDVWAAGDVAEFYDPLSAKYHTLGNWANASSQGRIVGANMAGERTVFETNSMYSINVFGINFSFLGDISLEEAEIIERGSVEDGKLARLIIRNDSISGASLINLPIERGVVGNLIKNKTKLSQNKEKLADLNFNLTSLLT